MSAQAIHLVVMQPVGYLHSQGFLDQARHVRWQLRRLGATVTLAKNRLREDAVNLIFGAHLGFPVELQQRHACIFFNLEQLGAGGAAVRPEYLALLHRSAVVDYHPANVAAYAEDAADVPIVPLLYSPFLDHGDTLPLEQRPIDLLFFGSLNERRRAVIARVEACGLQVAMFDHALYGDERDAYVRQAKAVLNTPFYASSRFEQARASHCLSLGTPVISERLDTSMPPVAFEDAVTWLGDGELESFFRDRFGRPAFFDEARAQLERFKRHDGRDAYAELLSFATGYAEGHARYRPTGPWQPRQLWVGRAGAEHQPAWCQIASDATDEPHLVLDLGLPLALPLQLPTRRGGEVSIDAGQFERIACQTAAEVPDWAQMIRNMMTLLAEHGEVDLEVPYEKSWAAWSQPTHRRAFSEASWACYVERFWTQGWLDHRFEVAASTWLDGERQPCKKEAGVWMRLTLRKIPTSPRERTLARAQSADFGGVSDDLGDLCASASSQRQTQAISFVAAPACAPAATAAPIPTFRLAQGMAVHLDEVSTQVDALIASRAYDDAVKAITVGVLRTFMLPELTHHALYYPELDRQMARLAQQLSPEAAAEGTPSRSATGPTVIIATALFDVGGHSRVLEDLSHEVEQPVVVLTDLFDSATKDPRQQAWIASRLKHAQVIVLPQVDLWSRCQLLRQLVNSFDPAQIFYMVHHHDPVPFIATLQHAGSRKVFFHHCDHNPSLGGTLPSLQHVDFTESLRDRCRVALDRPSTWLPLYVADHGVKSFSTVRPGEFSVVTSGRAGKFTRRGRYALQAIVATALQTVSGRFFHVGPLAADWLAEIRAHLQQEGIDPKRFESLGQVPSLWLQLQQTQAEVYIGSAPISGGRAGIEAQGCGYPVLHFAGFEEGSLLADYSSYASPELGWSDLKGLRKALQRVGKEHAAYSARARGFYEQGFSRQHFRARLDDILSA